MAETIAAQAQADDDARLALSAVDRARAALETMMRATGLIGGDGNTFNIDARKQSLAFADLSVDELRAIARLADAGKAPITIDVTALPAAETVVDLREESNAAE